MHMGWARGGCQAGQGMNDAGQTEGQSIAP